MSPAGPPCPPPPPGACGHCASDPRAGLAVPAAHGVPAPWPRARSAPPGSPTQTRGAGALGDSVLSCNNPQCRSPANGVRQAPCGWARRGWGRPPCPSVARAFQGPGALPGEPLQPHHRSLGQSQQHECRGSAIRGSCPARPSVRPSASRTHTGVVLAASVSLSVVALPLVVPRGREGGVSSFPEGDAEARARGQRVPVLGEGAAFRPVSSACARFRASRSCGGRARQVAGVRPWRK